MCINRAVNHPCVARNFMLRMPHTKCVQNWPVEEPVQVRAHGLCRAPSYHVTGAHVRSYEYRTTIQKLRYNDRPVCVSTHPHEGRMEA